MSKKAQAEIIVTILIILLVLAAIVIVWQVVNSTVVTGTKQIDDQSKCMVLSFEVNKVNDSTYSVKRSANGEEFNESAVKLIVLIDGERKEEPQYRIIGSNTINKPLGTARFAVTEGSCNQLQTDGGSCTNPTTCTAIKDADNCGGTWSWIEPREVEVGIMIGSTTCQITGKYKKMS